MMPTRCPPAAALALAALLATGCAAIDPNDLLSRHFVRNPAAQDSPVSAPANAPLGDAGRRAAFDFVWSTVNSRYYDPAMNGVDWKAAGERWRPRALAADDDEAFWDELDRMTGELRDAHTRVESPKRAELIARHESVSLGFGFRPLDGQLVVTSVHPESDAFWSGVRRGMALAEVEGKPAQVAYAAWLEQARASSTAQARHHAAARQLLAGEPGSTANLTFLRGDATPLTVTLKRRRFASPPSASHRVLPSGFGYIRLTSWDQWMQGRMVEAIEALKDTPGLVIDLRGNPGGSVMMVRNVAAQFFKGKVLAGRSLTRTGKPITLAFDWIEVVKIEQEIEGSGTYLGPVAVLVNADSGSGSELFAGILQSQGRATIVGQTTCGCLLGFLGYAQVPGGGRLAYSEIGFVLPNGQRIEGEGVVPDAPVKVTAAELLVDRDRALEVAQAHLLNAMPRKEAAAAGDLGR